MRALYLSYDGMTDPLGQSQVIPYLAGLAAAGHKMSIISFEKPDRFEKGRAHVGKLLEGHGIGWHPLKYHKKPPILSTVWDAWRMGRKARELHREQRFDLVHCRSYISSLVGLGLKRELGLKFIFDMRGFWADERVDGGLWNLKNPAYLAVYRYFKAREKEFLSEADSVVSLTHLARDEIMRWDVPGKERLKIEIIPCCADTEHFSREKVPAAELSAARLRVGLGERDFVVTYLGSVGTWYMVDEMFGFFARLLKRRPEARFLFITHDPREQVLAAAARAGVPGDRVVIVGASRAEVPALLSLATIGLFFIKPAYSKMSSSPTKLGELLAMGIPVVMNARVGDSDWLASRYKIGGLVRECSEAEFDRVIGELDSITALSSDSIRQAAREYFSLTGGVDQYRRIYDSI